MSSARARLFQLADLVRESRDETVVILETRGGSERLLASPHYVAVDHHSARLALNGEVSRPGTRTQDPPGRETQRPSFAGNRIAG